MRSRTTAAVTGLIAAAVAGTALASPAAARSMDGGHRSTACRQAPAGHAHLRVIGLTVDGSLICFRDDRPGRPSSSHKISGLAGDTMLVGIDVRPATGGLYGLGNAGGIYLLDANTGKATKQAQLSVALMGKHFGIDFNPTVDRLRVISDAGQNLRVNVTDGVALTDGTLNTGPGTTSLGVVGAAYTNNDSDPATGTTLYDLDTTNDQVVIQSPPNNGSLAATGKLGVDTSAHAGMDIFSTVSNGSTQSVKAFAALTTSKKSAFYAIDLITGRATLVGAFDRHVKDVALPVR